MGLTATHLVDKSARARMEKNAVWDVIGPMIEDGLLATCGAVELEILWSERSATHIAEARRESRDAFMRLSTTELDFARAEDVIQKLAEKGFHRSAGLADLLVAAVAERHKLTVLHYDADFERIAEVTGQPVQWVVPRGSAD